ncbi:type IV secretory system conjugative DNA transfer family protein [Tunturiibacter gelidoferens]|uniref:Type IV secretion system protein VirD4 n=1 Tax=Tunturiibacter gelidiferens TaxID=3069689 RepID=A0A9X0U7U7_9BACT|nr:type IV secretory system conjugative DNA transfer family protein [Edaphobacter lichenicola]MBB5331372.1 type IV secretion system protein VirD4 [Edaphobacter lichenicola]
MSLKLILGRRGAHTRTIGFAKQPASRSGELITYSGDGHLMTFSPTGGGKTSGPVICNALTHRGQLIVIDIKGEIYAKTAAARRAMGQEVHVLDMSDRGLPGSLNPLDLLMLSGTDYTAMSRSFAAELIERGDREKERFWNDWAETLISGALVWLLADCPAEKRRLSEVFNMYMADDVNYQLAILLDTHGKKMDKAARAAFASYLQISAEVTRDGVLSSTQTHLRLFDSEMIRRLTDTSSMDVAALALGEPMTLYIIVPPLRLKAYAPILRLWLTSLIMAMTQRSEPPPERTLMLCDEIGNLGRIDAFLTASTLMRSWGLTLWSFWQNVAQLQIYGSQANTLVDNAGVIQTFGAKNMRMAQDLANMIGGVSADQIMALGPEEQILLIDAKVIKCKQARYYNDELFKSAV